MWARRSPIRSVRKNFVQSLRRNRHVAAAYGALKRRLASSLVDDDDYPDVKDPAVDLIYLAAEQWAAQSPWEPGIE
jgi:GrpB-like predicted nucleotidyltransferase (UPF0157 family)